jgi:phosphoglycerate kinase
VNIRKMSEIDLNTKRVLIREDFNVPLEKGRITSEARLQAALPTLRAALDANAYVMVMSHLGRPAEGSFQAEYSLAPVADRLSQLLSRRVPLVKEWLSGVNIRPGEMVLCENVRFNVGEKSNDEALAKKMAALCDVFVMDAFGTAHRAEASTYGVAQFAPIACAGPLLSAELAALDKAFQNPAHPLLAIVGGSKVSTKLEVLDSLIDKVDVLMVGGGIANTFLAAMGYPVGHSLYEKDLLKEAHHIWDKAEKRGIQFPLPIDVVVASEISATAKTATKQVKEVGSDDKIGDIGPETSKAFAAFIKKAATIIWNGPVGVFELEPFARGTQDIALAIANSSGFSLAGGGDTLAAIERYDIENKVGYISTGGGAFLEYLEGKKLPAVAILEQRAL